MPRSNVASKKRRITATLLKPYARLIAILAGTDNIFFSINRCAYNIDLDFLLLLRIVSPPLTDIREYNRKILGIKEQILLTHLLINKTHIIREMPLDHAVINFVYTSCRNCRSILRNEPIPKAKEIISDRINGFLSCLFGNRSFFF